MESYITALYDRTLYTSEVQTMITDAQNALSDYESYSDYNDLKDRLDSAISYAQNLPTETIINEQIESIPEY